MFQERKGITRLLCNDTVYAEKENRTEALSAFFSPEVKKDANPLSIKVSSFAFQTAPKIAVTGKLTLVDGQNISCPPGKESAREF